MLKTRTIIPSAENRCAIFAAPMTLFLLFIWSPLVSAVDVPRLFTAEVPFDERRDQSRDDAYKAALVEVLTRVSGSELGSNSAAIAELFPEPGAYVTQYRPGEDDSLWVSFDGDAIERILRNAGQTVWGSDRPLTLVWLAVDWGQGVREIIAADDPERIASQSRSIDRNRLLRERMLEMADQRGLPLAFPLLDTTDLQSVMFSDIWGGFNERIVEASERYDAKSILIGRVRPSSGQRNRWTYFFGDEQRDWTGAPETVVARIADLLAAEFAVGGNIPLEVIALDVSGIASVDAYGSVQNILGSVSLIEDIKIDAVDGDTVHYQIAVRGGENRLRRALRFAGLIEQDNRETGDFGGFDSTAELEFFYSP